jgi:hypothetical protein
MPEGVGHLWGHHAKKLPRRRQSRCNAHLLFDVAQPGAGNGRPPWRRGLQARAALRGCCSLRANCFRKVAPPVSSGWSEVAPRRSASRPAAPRLHLSAGPVAQARWPRRGPWRLRSRSKGPAVAGTRHREPGSQRLPLRWSGRRRVWWVPPLLRGGKTRVIADGWSQAVGADTPCHRSGTPLAKPSREPTTEPRWQLSPPQ